MYDSRRLVTLRVTAIVFVVFMNCDCGYCKCDTNLTLPSEFKGTHQEIIDRYYDKRKGWKTSNLGSILFKNANPEQFRNSTREKQKYVVLIWKTWHWLKERHIDNYKGNKAKPDPLSGCSVRNCIFTGNHSLIDHADVVVIHSWASKNSDGRNRTSNQKWVFLSDESPQRLYTLRLRDLTYREIADQYNWTMTYRTFSDVPVPYGRTVPRSKPRTAPEKFEKLSLAKLIPHWFNKKMDVLAVILASRKVSFRLRFLKELKKYMNVDVFGAIEPNHNASICPGFFRRDCQILEQYFFYLALENARCRQYMTTHLFWNAFQKGAIPVILGPPLEDCEQLLPPKSFIHVEQFNSMEQLAKHMKDVATNFALLRGYHRWRNHFEIVNEHGYFKSKSYHYCRLCEALNYNDNQVSTYCEYESKTFFDSKINCVNFEAPIFKPTWAEYEQDGSDDKCVSMKSDIYVQSTDDDVTELEIYDEDTCKSTDSEIITKDKEKNYDDNRKSIESEIIATNKATNYNDSSNKSSGNEIVSKNKEKQDTVKFDIPDDHDTSPHKQYESQNIESPSECEICTRDHKYDIIEQLEKRNVIDDEIIKSTESLRSSQSKKGTVLFSHKKINRNRKSVEFKSDNISERTVKPTNKKNKRHNRKHKRFRNATVNKNENEISSAFTTEHLQQIENKKLIGNQYFLERQNWKTSNLGSILFKNFNATQFDQSSNQSYVVLHYIPKDLGTLKSLNVGPNPLEHCSVKNCVFTVAQTITNEADAIVFHAIPSGLQLPHAYDRKPDQLWILWADHSDYKYFIDNKIQFNLIAGVFNWTMSFRTDADVPTPYGRTIALPEPLMSPDEFENTALADIVPYWTLKQRDVLVGTVAYQNAPYRYRNMIIGKLNSNDVDVEVINCTRTEDCEATAKYLFHLVIEPVICRQYFSETLFYYAYMKGAIPVILGPPLIDCERLLPPDSFIHVDQHKNIKKLSAHLKAVAEEKVMLRKYHKWRMDFSIVNEYGYFGTEKLQLCRLCEALNYNDRETKIYYEDDLRTLFDPALNCVKTFYKIFNVFGNVTNANIYGDSVNVTNNGVDSR